MKPAEEWMKEPIRNTDGSMAWKSLIKRIQLDAAESRDQKIIEVVAALYPKRMDAQDKEIVILREAINLSNDAFNAIRDCLNEPHDALTPHEVMQKINTAINANNAILAKADETLRAWSS